MRWDQLCLRVMLWSLGMTAALGITTIFTSGGDFPVRLVGTAAATAVAAGLVWPLTRIADKPERRVAGLVGIGAVLVDFALMLLIIWGRFFADPLGLGYRWEEDLLAIFFFVALTAAPAVVFLLFLHHPAAWLMTRVGVMACVLAFLQLVAGTLGNHRWYRGDRWFEAAGATALFGSLGVACLVGTLRERPWRWLGVLASLVGWGALSVHVFAPSHSPTGEMLFALITTVAAVAAYANLFSLPKLSPKHEIFRLGTIGLAMLTAMLIDVLVLDEIFRWSSGGGIGDLIGRLAAASGIVTACGTLAILILALVHRSHGPQAAIAVPWIDVGITCPACGAQQKVPLGESVCATCRLPFYIRIGERKR